MQLTEKVFTEFTKNVSNFKFLLRKSDILII